LIVLIYDFDTIFQQGLQYQPKVTSSFSYALNIQHTHNMMQGGRGNSFVEVAAVQKVPASIKPGTLSNTRLMPG